MACSCGVTLIIGCLIGKTINGPEDTSDAELQHVHSFTNLGCAGRYARGYVHVELMYDYLGSLPFVDEETSGLADIQWEPGRPGASRQLPHRR